MNSEPIHHEQPFSWNVRSRPDYISEIRAQEIESAFLAVDQAIQDGRCMTAGDMEIIVGEHVRIDTNRDDGSVRYIVNCIQPQCQIRSLIIQIISAGPLSGPDKGIPIAQPKQSALQQKFDQPWRFGDEREFQMARQSTGILGMR